MNQRCENCAYSENPQAIGTGPDSYVEVRCQAPVPAFLSCDDDDRITGHLAAKDCELFHARSV